jgi:hypothetical protein
VLAAEGRRLELAVSQPAVDRPRRRPHPRDEGRRLGETRAGARSRAVGQHADERPVALAEAEDAELVPGVGDDERGVASRGADGGARHAGGRQAYGGWAADHNPGGRGGQ